MISAADVNKLPRDPETLLKVICELKADNENQQQYIARLKSKACKRQKNIIELTTRIEYRN